MHIVIQKMKQFTVEMKALEGKYEEVGKAGLGFAMQLARPTEVIVDLMLSYAKVTSEILTDIAGGLTAAASAISASKDDRGAPTIAELEEWGVQEAAEATAEKEAQMAALAAETEAKMKAEAATASGASAN